MKITFDTRPKVLVAYHDHCIDGYTAAWVAQRALKAKGLNPHLLPMSYNRESTQKLLDTLEKTEADYAALYVVDFSLDLIILHTIAELFPNLATTILDHHKTAFEKYAPTTAINSQAYFVGEVAGADIILKNNFSGASLCWNYFHIGETVPQLITHVEDYDLWKFRFGDATKHLNKYLVAQLKDLGNWDRIAKRLETGDGFNSAVNAGRDIQIEHDKKVAEIAAKAGEIELCGYKGLVVDCPHALTSDVGHALATKCGTFGAMYIIDLEAKKTKWSLRSNGDFDVSEIAKFYGGGGHKNAAGYEVLMEGKEGDSDE